MLVANTGQSIATGQFCWYINDKRPSHEAILRVLYIQADGHELEHIKAKFTNYLSQNPTIPIPCNQVCVWYGDIARTILANL